jgi:ADP-ribose pyrophosphatase YjhB (NUDIX family)
MGCMTGVNINGNTKNVPKMPKWKQKYIKRKKIKRAKILFLGEHNGNQTITLFKNKYWDTYDIPGGRVDNNQTFQEALIREIKEETFNTIDLSELFSNDNKENNPQFIDINNDREHIRVYILKFDMNKVQHVYDTNKENIRSNSNVPREWLEMDEYSTFEMNKLETLLLTTQTTTNHNSQNKIQTSPENYKIVDIYGNVNTLYKNTIQNIGHAYKNDLFKTERSINKIIQKNCGYTIKNITSGRKFLINTRMITLTC